MRTETVFWIQLTLQDGRSEAYISSSMLFAKIHTDILLHTGVISTIWLKAIQTQDQ